MRRTRRGAARGRRRSATGSRDGGLGSLGQGHRGRGGFFTGGPVGALVGAALGHAADSGRAGPGGGLPPGAATLAALLGSKEQLFSIGVVVLSAKLAKCDGPVRREEIDAFKRMFRIPPENLREVGRLFDSARENAEGHEPFAEKLGAAFADNKAMLEDVLAALFQIARADGPLTNAEVAFLQWGAGPLRPGRPGLGARAGRAHGGRRRPAGPDRAGPLRRARRAAQRERRGGAPGLAPPDAREPPGRPGRARRAAGLRQRATDKVAEINAAWDRIKRDGSCERAPGRRGGAAPRLLRGFPRRRRAPPAV
jgi:DnaJ like chaperone protein